MDTAIRDQEDEKENSLNLHHETVSKMRKGSIPVKTLEGRDWSKRKIECRDSEADRRRKNLQIKA